MFNYLLNDQQKKLKQEARDFVKSIPRKMILDMDADEITFPKEFLQEAGRLNLMGCRYPEKWGGRGLDWVSTCMVMGGIGYTNIYPVERIFRDLRLASIWTGTNEVMSMIIANEWYNEFGKNRDSNEIRDMELDAAEAEAKDEKIFS